MHGNSIFVSHLKHWPYLCWHVWFVTCLAEFKPVENCMTKSSHQSAWLRGSTTWVQVLHTSTSSSGAGTLTVSMFKRDPCCRSLPFIHRDPCLIFQPVCLHIESSVFDSHVIAHCLLCTMKSMFGTTTTGENYVGNNLLIRVATLGHASSVAELLEDDHHLTRGMKEICVFGGLFSGAHILPCHSFHKLP